WSGPPRRRCRPGRARALRPAHTRAATSCETSLPLLRLNRGIRRRSPLNRALCLAEQLRERALDALGQDVDVRRAGAIGVEAEDQASVVGHDGDADRV